MQGKCLRCGNQVGRLFTGQICGVCEITLAGKMPALNVGYYEDQINPEVFEPDKERMIGIKHLYQTGQLTAEEATRYKKALVDPLIPHEQRLREDRKYREAWRTEARVQNELADIQERESSEAKFKAEKEMKKLSGEISAGIVPER